MLPVKRGVIMSTFQVQVEGMHIQQEQLLRLQRDVMVISDRVCSVRMNLAGMSCGFEIGKSLSKCNQLLRNNANSIGSLSTVLGSAADLYNKTEPAITGAATADVSIEKGNAVHWDGFNSIFDNAVIRPLVDLIQTAIEDYIGKVGSEAIAEEIMRVVMRLFPDLFIDRGLIGSLIGGGQMLLTETPTWLVQVIRSGAKYIAPVIGAAFDYSLQRLRGVDPRDAWIKAGAHAGIGFLGHMAGAKAGAAIGTVVAPGVGTAIGAAIGALIGIGGSVGFDYIYDNREAVGKAINDAVNYAGNWIGDRIEDVGDAIEGAGRWLNETGAKIGNAFNDLGNAFSFSW